MTNLSSEDQSDLHYSTTAEVGSTRFAGITFGNVTIQVDFVLPVYGESPTMPTDTVSVQLLVSQWPWQNGTDHLAITYTAAPAYVNTEKLVFGTSPSSLVTSVSWSNGTPLEQLGVSTEAVADPGTPASTNVTAVAAASGSAPAGTVTVSFGTGTGTYFFARL